MKNLHTKLVLITLSFLFAGTAVIAQFDDLYYDASADATYDKEYIDEQSYELDDAYAYEDYDGDSYEYFDDYTANDDYYDGYYYSRRINRFNRGFNANNFYSYMYTNPLYLDPFYATNFWYDPFYARSFRRAYLNPFVYRPGVSVAVTFGNPYFGGFYGRNNFYSPYNRFGPTFGGIGYGGYGGFAYGGGGFGGAYYCPPVGITSAVGANRPGTVVNNRSVQRTVINSSRNRGRTDGGVISTNRRNNNTTISNARGTNSVREVSQNGRKREYSSSRDRGSVSKSTRSNLTKTSTSRSRNNSSIRNSTRSSNSIRRSNGTSRPTRINSGRSSNIGRSSGTRSSGTRINRGTSGSSRSSGVRRGTSSSRSSGTTRSRSSSSRKR